MRNVILGDRTGNWREKVVHGELKKNIKNHILKRKKRENENIQKFV